MVTCNACQHYLASLLETMDCFIFKGKGYDGSKKYIHNYAKEKNKNNDCADFVKKRWLA